MRRAEPRFGSRAREEEKEKDCLFTALDALSGELKKRERRGLNRRASPQEKPDKEGKIEAEEGGSQDLYRPCCMVFGFLQVQEKRTVAWHAEKVESFLVGR